jgi:hypothetical protein
MAVSRGADIARLCDAWIAAATSSGGIVIGPATEQHRLHRNGIQFHELTYDDTQAACVGLTRVLILPGLNTIIDVDHTLFWAWIAELLLSSDAGVFTDRDDNTRRLFEVAVRAALVGARDPTQTHADWERQRRSVQALEHNAKEFLGHKDMALVYLALPLLEALTKRKCAEFVDETGMAKRRFRVPQRNGQPRLYGPGDRCNSIGHLLWLLWTDVADDDLRSLMSSMRTDLSRLDARDPFYLVNDWRNSSLHGEASFPTIGGTLMNLGIVIALNDVRERYEALRQRTLEHVVFQMRTRNTIGMRPPWSYYPPY